MGLIPSEQEFWVLDQEINNRGIRVDLPAIRNALAIVELEKKRMDAAMQEATGFQVRACSQAAALLEWAKGQGVDLSAVAKNDINEALSRADLPGNVRKALLLRQEAARSSTAKLKAMAAGASAEGRVKGTAQYHGATTGRQAGRRLQPQNFVRPTLLNTDEINAVMDLLGERA
jgi:DNA polymerase